MQDIKQKRQTERSTKLIDFKHIHNLSKQLKSERKKTVFTIGSFDLLNPGHCRYLAEAKAQGDVLVVGVATNFSDTKLKGPDYPLTSEDIRAELVSYLKTVDYILFVDEYRPHAVLSLLQPDIFYTNKIAWEDGTRDDQEKLIIESYGGKIFVRDTHQPYIGTNDLVDHIANVRVAQILQSYLKDFTFDAEKHFKPAVYGLQRPSIKKAYDAGNVIIDFANLKKLGQKLRKAGKKTVFVAGSYDLLHVGHARFIEQAGVLGDILVVGIPSDTSLKKLKGLGRPIICEYSRAYVLGHLDPVDYVVIFDHDTIYESLEVFKPDVFFTVAEAWNNGYKDSREYKLVKNYGGEVVRTERQAPFLSSSAIIDKMANKKVKEIFKDCMDESKFVKILQEKSRL